MRKTLSILVCVAMLAALLPIMAISGSAAPTDLLGGKGAFDSDISLFDVSGRYSGCDQTSAADCINAEHSGHSAFNDNEVFTWSETEGVDGSGALKITPTGKGGNTPQSSLIEGMDPTKLYTVSAKIKWQGAYMLWNMYAPSIDAYTARWANVYLIGTDASTYTTLTSGPDADGWYTWSMTFKGGDAAWSSMTMVPSVYAVGGTTAVMAGQAIDAANHWILLDDLTITTHEDADADGDNRCDTTYYDWTKAGTATANFPQVYTTCATDCPVTFGEVVVDNDLYEGAYCGEAYDLTATGASKVLNAVNITPGTIYEVSYWYKTLAYTSENKEITSRVNVRLPDDTARIANVNTPTDEYDADGYRKYTFLFSTENTAHTKASFQVYNTASSSAGSGYLKDFRVVEHEHVATDLTGICTDTVYTYTATSTGAVQYTNLATTVNEKIVSDDLVYGFGTMDSQEAVDLIFDNATYSAAEGAATLGTSGGQNTVEIPMEPGVMYTLSFKIKFAGTPSSFLVGIMEDAGTFETGIRWISPGYTNAVNTWEEKTFTFCADTWTTVGIRLLPGAADGFTATYVDDFKIVKHVHDDGATVDAACETKYYHYTSEMTGLQSLATTTCGASLSGITGATATLGDVIEMNLAIVSGETDASKIKIALDAADFAKNASQTATGMTLDVTGTAPNYTAKVVFPAKNMADEFTAKLMVDGVEIDSVTTSVKEYAMKVITGTDEAYVKAAPVAKAMLNYGAKAQAYFGYNTTNPANGELSAEDQAISVDAIVGNVVEESVDMTDMTVNGDFDGDESNASGTAWNGFAGTKEVIASGSELHGNVLHLQGAGSNNWIILNKELTAGTYYKATFKVKTTLADDAATEGSNKFARIAIANGGYNQPELIGATMEKLTDADGYHLWTAVFTPAETKPLSSKPSLLLQIHGSTTDHYYIDDVVVREATADEVSGANKYPGFGGNASQAALWTYNTANVAFSLGKDATYGDIGLATIINESGITSGSTHINFNLGSALESGKQYVLSYDAKLTSSTATSASLYPLAYATSATNTGITRSTISTEWTHVETVYTGSAETYYQLRIMTALGYGDVISIANLSVKEYVEPVASVDTYKATVTDELDSFMGYTLVLKDATSVRLYMDAEPTSVKVGETACDIVKSGDVWYAEIITAVGAQALDTVIGDITVTVGENTMTISGVSVMAPAAIAATSTTVSETLKDVSIALILYAEAVNAYTA